jgi:hypothetical protein
MVVHAISAMGFSIFSLFRVDGDTYRNKSALRVTMNSSQFNTMARMFEVTTTIAMNLATSTLPQSRSKYLSAAGTNISDATN